MNDLRILAAWNIGVVRSVATPNAGTINRTVLVEAEAGAFVLRGYRHAERAPVEREHSVIAHAASRGIPAVAPIALPGGDTILEREGRFYALFPRAPGRQVAREALRPAHFAAMGGFLARLHEALADFPPEQAPRRPVATDRDATLERIDFLETQIRARPTRDAVDEAALNQLEGRREWLRHSFFTKMPDLSALGEQLIHGDYQQDNLFFGGERVVAIIDWDQTYVAARAWEIARVLDLACGYQPEPSRAFLDGYRAQADLDQTALDLAAHAYALMRAHDLWLYDAIYVEGNDRPRRFLPPGPFVPLSERWAELRRVL